MKQNNSIIIIVLVLAVVGLIGGLLYMKSKDNSQVISEEPPKDSLDIAIDKAYAAADAQDQANDAYSQGANDANKLREKRERAALLTGGFSEIGRALGFKPFG